MILSFCDMQLFFLMYAEVLNEESFDTDINSKNSGFYYLNKVRDRAGLPNLTSLEVPSQSDFKKLF